MSIINISTILRYMMASAEMCTRNKQTCMRQIRCHQYVAGWPAAQHVHAADTIDLTATRAPTQKSHLHYQPLLRPPPSVIPVGHWIRIRSERDPGAGQLQVQQLASLLRLKGESLRVGALQRRNWGGADETMYLGRRCGQTQAMGAWEAMQNQIPRKCVA